jgi:hypothetical protein
MRILKQATDLTTLRQLVRFALVAFIATVLISQVTAVRAQLPAQLTCPQRCAISVNSCQNGCETQRAANTAFCAFQEQLCEFNCVLNGFTFGAGFAACQATCKTAQATCVAGIAATYTACTNTCQFTYQVCLLVCQFFTGP